MKLTQTIQMMKSSDYKQRFLGEYFQLKIRYDSLKAMVEKYKAGTLEFTPNCPMEVYKIQLEAMERYLDVLVIRARIEGISLDEIKEKKFKLEDYPDNYVMHCKSEKDAKTFCKYLHDSGKCWHYGESYAETTYWDYHQEDTAYEFNTGFFGDLDCFKADEYKVLEFSDFDW